MSGSGGKALRVPPSSKEDQTAEDESESEEESSSEKDIVLPVPMTTNPRSVIIPHLVTYTSADKLVLPPKEEKPKRLTPLWWVPERPLPPPVPKSPLTIMWWPKVLCFEFGQKLVVKKLNIMNRSNHSIYVLYCGLWGDLASLGAGWWCLPKTRMLLAPGLDLPLTVHARPHECSPVPDARFWLQLAASNKLDMVVGYFKVPIYVRFRHYFGSSLAAEDP